MANDVTHQFGMFGFVPGKIRMMDSKEKARFSKVLRQGKAKMLKGDFKGAAEDVREVREFFESFERRLSNAASKAKQREKPKRRFKAGDEVFVEIGGNGKSEFVDATVLAVTSKGVTIRTYWGHDIEHCDPHLVRRR
jgi:uncharacterized protein with gpF-like domain